MSIDIENINVYIVDYTFVYEIISVNVFGSLYRYVKVHFAAPLFEKIVISLPVE